MTKFDYDMYKAYKELNNKTDNTTRQGINALELLLIAFIVLKLCKVITWSWWWVLSPIWIPLGLYLAVVLLVMIIELASR